MQSHHVTFGKGGRIVVPVEYRRALNLKPGDDLIIKLEDDELRLFRRSEALHKIRAALKKSIKKINHIDEFLAFRKEDSA